MLAVLCCSRAPQAVLQGDTPESTGEARCSTGWSMASAGYLPLPFSRIQHPTESTQPEDSPGEPKQPTKLQPKNNQPLKRAKFQPARKAEGGRPLHAEAKRLS